MRQLKINNSITKRDSESVEIYLRDIGHRETITVDEEVELTRRIHKGDERALNALVEANLRFVVSVAKQFQNQGLPLSDLISEGNIGLIKAAQRFDETRGFKFISFAVWWIRQSILAAIAEKASTIRVPLNQQGVNSKVRRATSQFKQQFMRDPSPEELAEMADLPIEKVIESFNTHGKTVSYDCPVTDDENTPMIDLLPGGSIPSTDSTLDTESLAQDIEELLKDLSVRDREIIRLCFGIGSNEMTLDEIGARFNLSRERVRQLREVTLTRLRRSGRTLQLRKYLS